jgi:hypothetical protein
MSLLTQTKKPASLKWSGARKCRDCGKLVFLAKDNAAIDNKGRYHHDPCPGELPDYLYDERDFEDRSVDSDPYDVERPVY